LHDLERVSPADAGLLDLEERRGLPMSVGCVLVFDGPAPALAELCEHVGSRLERVPRYRRRIVPVPLRQGRPLWVEDERLSLSDHVRRIALPGEADELELGGFAAHVFADRGGRGGPLWELWLVERLAGGRFALIARSHEVLVDGGANRELVSVLLDGERERPEPVAAKRRSPRPLPRPSRLLLRSLAERAADPREALTAARAAAARTREELQWHGLDPLERLDGTAACRFNGPVGPYRRFAWVDAGLKGARRAKERLGGTVNDVVLTAVAGALGEYLRAQGDDTEGLALRALVPLADASSGRLLATFAPLPVGIADARRRHAEISRALDGLRASGRALAAAELLDLEGFAPATTVARAARLQAAQRAFNLAVVNVPGPQGPRRLLGRELRAAYPALPLARNQGLSIALISYAGRLCFGLLADPERVADLPLLARLLAESLSGLPKKRAKGSS
jgi:diacylglycerol O-acyltransferase / wax synthase